MAKKHKGAYKWEPPVRQQATDPNRPANKHKRANYKKYRGQGR